MKFTLESADNAKLVTNYGPGFFEINRVRFNTGLCLYQDGIFENWNENNPAELSVESFQQILTKQPEILILGTGSSLIFPPPDLIATLHKFGAVLETMDTSAACRTYNVLVSERRRVAAALMLIEKL